MSADGENHVFINCPFDDEYRPLFEAMVFTILECGFVARSAVEVDDSSQVRIDKVGEMIAESRLGIHDISRTGPIPFPGFPVSTCPWSWECSWAPSATATPASGRNAA